MSSPCPPLAASWGLSPPRSWRPGAYCHAGLAPALPAALPWRRPWRWQVQFRRPVDGSYTLQRNWSALEAQLVDDDDTDVILVHKHFQKAAPEALAEQEVSPEDVEMAETQHGAAYVRLSDEVGDASGSASGAVPPSGAPEVLPAPANVQLKPTRKPGAARAMTPQASAACAREVSGER